MLNIVLVDDEAYALEGIVQSLDWESYDFCQPMCAANTKQARELLRQHTVHLVLCDIEMPEESGIDFLRWVRAEYPQIICCFLTCHAEFSYAREAVSLGLKEYLLKPVSAEELVRVLMETAHAFPEQIRAAQSLKSNISIERVEQFINENINNDISCESVAKQFYMHPDHLSRLYKKKRGILLSDYILRQRIAYARELLELTDLPVSEIALQAGYNNFSYFSRLFKKCENMTPKQYRERKRQAKKRIEK